MPTTMRARNIKVGFPSDYLMIISTLLIKIVNNNLTIVVVALAIYKSCALEVISRKSSIDRRQLNMAKLSINSRRILALAGLCAFFVVSCRGHTILSNEDYEILKSIVPHKGYHKQAQMMQDSAYHQSEAATGEVNSDSSKLMPADDESEDPDVYSTKIPCKRVYSGFFLPDKFYLDGAKLLDNNYKKNHKLYICVD